MRNDSDSDYFAGNAEANSIARLTHFFSLEPEA